MFYSSSPTSSRSLSMLELVPSKSKKNKGGCGQYKEGELYLPDLKVKLEETPSLEQENVVEGENFDSLSEDSAGLWFINCMDHDIPTPHMDFFIPYMAYGFLIILFDSSNPYFTAPIEALNEFAEVYVVDPHLQGLAEGINQVVIIHISALFLSTF
ncbi:uncharacterized protein LACBIDRAFT_335651 [Laccaria bicolor S238N-H82]|uniref:Predicted protein n=1 Tax=Laccaria bicolor (strain S238N-H82 / ATCC MYA-4686) TaxID=486041 RepID=B0E2Y8_LACBS|nr:uncharacterized protein LACBIDRAFT_335651 [Laccaria bicolor S238N-H82]EDQ98797.1 predicted protein [Laccaria bicolor S238N-H82]|eukprot:XP_001890556.1 predicted protein [Laccaria bicolor S238N-H82]